MQRRKFLPFVGLSELLVLAGTLAMLGAVLLPVWQRAGDDDTKQCLGNVRQMAMAALMFVQDHNSRFPDADWVPKLAGYLGNKAEMFHCPAVPAEQGKRIVCYGYSGLLLSADGKGVSEAQIAAPTMVGVICDADPVRPYPQGGITGGGGLLDSVQVAVQPCARHHHGLVIGYADGHAQYAAREPNTHDAANPTTQAFYTASPLGNVNNPVGGLSNFAVPADANTAALSIGGDMATFPIITAAAEAWKQKTGANYYARGFLGEGTLTGRTADYLWGFADGEKPSGNAIPIARDALVFIVSKDCEIATPSLHGKNGTAALDDATLHELFATAYRKYDVQAYSYNEYSGNTHFLLAHFVKAGKPLTIGANAVIATDDQNMVNLVAADPTGIGYCSSAMADPARVTVVGLVQPNSTVLGFPNQDPVYRWVYPATPPAWPLLRTLYVQCGGEAASTHGHSIASVMFAPGAAGTKALQAGPLFQAGYYRP